MSVQAFINGVWTKCNSSAWSGFDVRRTADPVGGVTIGPNTGWLACNGQAVSRTLYTGLFQAIGSTRGVEVTPDPYALGQFKDDQAQGHRHSIPDTSTTISGNKGGTAVTDFPQNTSDPVSDGTNGTPRTGGVTRGKRLGIHFAIKT